MPVKPAGRAVVICSSEQLLRTTTCCESQLVSTACSYDMKKLLPELCADVHLLVKVLTQRYAERLATKVSAPCVTDSVQAV